MKSAIVLQGIEIHPDSREVVVRGEVKHLPWRAFEVLLVLAERAGRVVPKEELLETVWSGAAVDESNLTQAVAQIRKALGEITLGKSYIETIPRIGYRMSVEAVPPPASAAASEARNGVVPTPPQRTGVPKRLLAALAAAAVLTLVAVIIPIKRKQAVEFELTEVPFTSFEGDEQSANFYLMVVT